MVTNSTSQTKNESEGQAGCEACIKKDETITDLYEALKVALGLLVAIDTTTTREVADICRQAIAKVED